VLTPFELVHLAASWHSLRRCCCCCFNHVIVAAVVLPAGLVLTPFALVHLAASWGQLSSIALDITAAGSAGGDPLQLVAGLASLTSLRDLSLRLAGGWANG
jgi:hypothetical protein